MEIILQRFEPDNEFQTDLYNSESVNQRINEP